MQERFTAVAGRVPAKGYRAGAAQFKVKRITFKKRLVKGSILLTNLVALGLILAFVLHNQKANTATAAGNLESASTSSSTANPLDQVSSADIALTVAQVGNLPETTAISNQAQSAAAEVAVASSNNDVISKPEVIGSGLLKSNADIVSYTSVAGDTVTSVAAKFGVTSDSVRWSNALNTDSLNPGTKLLIPPVNGIVYTVKAGDTPSTLASRFRADPNAIVAYNDAEISGLTPGESIVIPNGVQTSTTTTAANIANAASLAWGSVPIYGYNGYDYGYCTWYVASQIAVPANWGNASTWAYFASMSGWNVSKTPSVGAIAQIGGRVAYGQGHVAIVDAVSPDGSQVQFRDMNGIAGWGRVGYSGWVPASFFDNYITH